VFWVSMGNMGTSFEGRNENGRAESGVRAGERGERIQEG
jgi:hypothetical protein